MQTAQQGHILRMTSLSDQIRLSQKYQKWKNNILERDNYTCLKCGFKYQQYSNKDQGKYPLNVDHYPSPFWWLLKSHKISSLKKAKRCNQLWKPGRGRTLCVPCHKKTESYLKKH